LHALSPGVGYLNRNSDEEDQAQLETAYGARKYERLVALKNTYDPMNLFRVNHNIKPGVQLINFHTSSAASRPTTSRSPDHEPAPE